MSTIEETGRQALTEMRRILGVLRHPDDAAELAPQPGIGQIPALVEQARQDRQQVTLTVEGEPGPLPASVDLGLYRILQEALSGSGDKDVLLRFCAEDVQLTVVTPGRPHLDWPTPVMRERVALCQGGIDVDEQDQLVVRLPRLFEGART
jgi:signal transduction histidine kinase